MTEYVVPILLILMLASFAGNIAAITVTVIEWKIRKDALGVIGALGQQMRDTVEKIQSSHNAIVLQHGILQGKVDSHELRLNALSANLSAQQQGGMKR